MEQTEGLEAATGRCANAHRLWQERQGSAAWAARGPEGRRPAVPRPRASETTSSAQGPCRPGQWQQASPAWASSFPCSTSSDLLPSSVLRTTPPLATRWLRTCGATAPRSEHYIRGAQCQSVRCDSQLQVASRITERRCCAVRPRRCFGSQSATAASRLPQRPRPHQTSPIIYRRHRDLDERDNVRRRRAPCAKRTADGRWPIRKCLRSGRRCRGRQRTNCAALGRAVASRHQWHQKEDGPATVGFAPFR